MVGLASFTGLVAAPCWPQCREVGERHLESHQRQMRLDAIEFLAQRPECLGESTRRNDDGLLLPRPTLLDSPHDPVDRLRLAEHHSGADAVLGAPANDARRDHELRRRQLRRATHERLESRLDARRDDAANEHAVARYAVERGGGPHVDDDGVALEETARRERVDETISANGERLVDVDANRQWCTGIDEDHRASAQCLARRDERIRHSRYDGSDRGALYSIRAESVECEKPAQKNAEFVGGAVHARDDSPMATKGITLEQTDGRLCVADIEDENHAEPPGKLTSDSRMSEPA